ncbi:ZIP family metal transporter [Thermofilum pendens]|uniref:Zinc/iron permease n=1 Tax=Thermofilum pendens (strain DSM 2475 / Hrk 5) TaxID=368408 RepID=A1S144_THEPD|nr:ZIP family metal transporter [Thermofilum pendens]ABL79174.1 zinc/iron permease [Thermofilum pendens Hrk 5]
MLREVGLALPGDPVLASLAMGLFVAFTTSLGAVPVLFGKKAWRHFTLALSFSAGVMLVSSFTSLILPALEATRSFALVSSGILLGVLAIMAVDRLVPHEHLLKGYEGPPEGRRLLKKSWLIALAVIIHNIPEGLAVGTSIAYSVPLGVATGLAIGLQDIPEGFAVAFPMAQVAGPRKGLAYGVLSGLSETLMAVLGAYFFTVFSALLPIGMSFSGGAMLYVTVKEVVPEIYREQSGEYAATAGFLLGFLLMLFLDSML